MFDSILSLARDYRIPLPQEKAEDLSLQERIAIAERVIQYMASQHHLTANKKIRVIVKTSNNNLNFDFTRSSKVSDNAVLLPPYYFVTENELEKLTQGSDKPQDIANAVQEKLNYQQQLITPNEEKQIQRFISWRTQSTDPTDRKTQFAFSMAHELGHIAFEHGNTLSTIRSIMIDLLPFIISIPIISGLFIMTCLTATLAPVIIPSIFVVILLTTFLIDIFTYSILDKKQAHYLEYQADQFAAEMQGIEGGISFYKILEDFSNNRESKTHPAPSKRIDRLEKISATNLY